MHIIIIELNKKKEIKELRTFHRNETMYKHQSSSYLYRNLGSPNHVPIVIILRLGVCNDTIINQLLIFIIFRFSMERLLILIFLIDPISGFAKFF